MSTRVNLDDLEVGMVLAENAVHMNGRVLLGVGACLTKKHLNMFKTWGLTEAQISGGAGEEARSKASNSLDPGIISESEEVMRDSFIHMDMSFEPVSELLRISIKLHSENLSQGGADGANS